MGKQTLLFDNCSSKIDCKQSEWSLYVDGASRGNPGLAGGGFYITKGTAPIAIKGFFLEKKTNNEAEYFSLLLGLDYLLCHTDFQKLSDSVKIFADSLLLVRQVLGHYRVRSPHLIPLHVTALSILKEMIYSIDHVMREQNAVADQAANHGIDTRRYPLVSFTTLCKRYGITL